jgi:hypothetical protein
MLVKIVVCTHERPLNFEHELLMPIHCGKAINDMTLGILGDDIGENISILNPRFSELTGMYWAWKNLTNIDVIGICHYRRVFDFNKEIGLFLPYKHITYSKFKGLSIASNYFEKIFKRYDIILHQPYICQYDLETMYCRSHFSDDLLKVENIIKEIYPDYLTSYYYVMQRNNRASLHNLLVMPKKDYNDLCEWLFEILLKLDSIVDYSSYSDFQKRLPAIISERLVMVYVHHKKFKVKYLPFFWMKDEEVEQSYFAIILSRIKNTLLFPLIKLHL